jgi:hypothetical protein
MAALGAAAVAKVTALSTDGEATVYLTGDFSGDFDVAYDVAFEPAPANRSWTTVSIALLGRTPGASMAVGLSRGYPTPATLAGFTLANAAQQRMRYLPFTVTCTTTCLLELRSQQGMVYALIDGHRVGAWPRSAMPIAKPYLQINGEVSRIGDRILARLTPVHTLARGFALGAPTCAFTTQGIEPAAFGGRGALRFSGARDPSGRVTYLALYNGAPIARCAQESPRSNNGH